MTDVSTPGWYAVRCLLAVNEPAEDAERTYEERVTLWHARSHEEAIQRAEAEAEDYAGDMPPATYLGLAQSFQLFDAPADGVEVFSLMRDSALSPSDYLRAYFDTGTERQQDAP